MGVVVPFSAARSGTRRAELQPKRLHNPNPTLIATVALAMRRAGDLQKDISASLKTYG